MSKQAPPRPPKRSSLSGVQALQLDKENPPQVQDLIRAEESTRTIEKVADSRSGVDQSDKQAAPVSPSEMALDKNVSSELTQETPTPAQGPPQSLDIVTPNLANGEAFPTGTGHQIKEPKNDVESKPKDVPGAAENSSEDAKPQATPYKDPKTPTQTDFREKLMGAVDLILAVDSRLKSVEEKVHGKPQIETDAKPASESDRQPCIPQLKVVDWYNFKNRCKDDKLFAIEILKGPSAHYQDEHSEGRKVEKLKKSGLNPVRMQPVNGEEDASPQGVPERIRINSVPLNNILSDFDNSNYKTDRNPAQYLRPYKQLIRLERDITDHLTYLEKKWGAAEEEDRVDKEKALQKVDSADREDEDHTIQAAQKSEVKVGEGDIPLHGAENGKDSALAKGVAAESDPPVSTDLGSPASDPLTDSIEALRDVRCLRQFMDQYIYPTLNRFRDRTARTVRFEDLWYLFPHGEEVFVAQKQKVESSQTPNSIPTNSDAFQAVYRVYDHSGGRFSLSSPDTGDSDSVFRPLRELTSITKRMSPFCIMCYYIDRDSDSFAPVSHEIRIKPFDGERDITSLRIYPTAYHENFDMIRHRLVQRGRKFLGLTRPVHRRYLGGVYDCHPCGCSFTVNNTDHIPGVSHISSEVMIDFAQSPDAWRPNFGLDQCNYLMAETMDSWSMTTYKDSEHNVVDSVESEPTDNDFLDERYFREQASREDDFLRTWSSFNDNEGREPIQTLERDVDLVLLPSRAMGYSFRDRAFIPLDVDGLEDIVADAVEGFQGLALPEGHQRMVEALVKEHFIKKEAYERNGESIPGMDIIPGKGRGLIILLHGAPGVGKTSTAECVAQSSGRPLFSITCGDLGLKPETVEASLSEKFRLAAKWNCVLLLDEADIFLARRDKVNLERNALVSVFLRVLEYYEGILFLTTNRVGTIDDAFKSRIHVPLFYPELQRKQTIKIWKKNLARMRRIEAARAKKTNKPQMMIDDEEIIKYAKEHYDTHKQTGVGKWNGRQIRNAFQTAAALAYHYAGDSIPVLSTELFKDVANTTVAFDLYINKTLGNKDEEQRAYDSKERNDHLHMEHLTSDYYSGPVTPLSHPRTRFLQTNDPFASPQQIPNVSYNNLGYAAEISPEQQAYMAGVPAPNTGRVFSDVTRGSIHSTPNARSVAVSAHAASPGAQRSIAKDRTTSKSHIRPDSESDSEDE